MIRGFAFAVWRRKSIELSLVLTSRFRLLLPLQAGAYVMLSFLDFLDRTSLLAATLEALQSTL